MRILVTFAVEAEFAPWRKLRNFARTKGPSGVPEFTATVEQHKVEVVLTGMGEKACAESLRKLQWADGAQPEVVISSGLAGALQESLQPGEVVVAETVCAWNGGAPLAADTTLLEIAMKRGAVRVANLLTANRVIQTAAEKRHFAGSGEAVDMESAYIMAKCQSAGIPCVTMRAISDSATEDMPIDFERCLTPQGAVKPLALLKALVQRPSRIPKLVRFGRQSSHAAQNLIAYLDGFVGSIAKVEVRAR